MKLHKWYEILNPKYKILKVKSNQWMEFKMTNKIEVKYITIDNKNGNSTDWKEN